MDLKLRELSTQLADLQDMKASAVEEYSRSGDLSDQEAIISCNQRLLETYEKIQAHLERTNHAD